MSWVLNRLSKAGQRFFGVIRRAVERGVSYFRLRRAFEEAGFPRDQIPSPQDYNLGVEFTPYENMVRAIPRDSIIPEEYYLPVRKITGGKYLTKFHIVAYNPETGEIEHHYFSLVHDTLMRRDEMEDIVINRFKLAEGAGYPRLEIREIEPFSCWKVGYYG